MRSFRRACWLLIAGAAFTICRAEDLPGLTLQEAHETALHNHPLITVADLKALAARQVVREARSGFLPNLSANVVAVGTTENNTRLAAVGALNNPSIFDRNAEGLMISQLITDFGRTANLTGSAKLQAEAAANNAQATREQILLAVDGAFYSALQAQAVTRVADQTVTARQVFLDQVSALASNKLRSDLDVSFARVNLEDARLLLSKAQNDLHAAFTQLSTLMGFREPRSYRLAEQPLPPPLSTNASDFVAQALRGRPDLLSLRNQEEASLKFARAERALHYPTIAAVGSAGVSPIHDPPLKDTYAAAGVVLNLPIFEGGLYAARQAEAEARAQAADASLRDLENNVIRDVRITWLNAQNAFDRYRITGQLLDNARQSYELAQARYKNQISSIVEFNQAELNLISAQINYANTLYEYLVQRSALSFQTGALR
ncbi:MAG TPA: TolC family protein [Candidatus Binatia bacterium]|jgi:outer membrane protein|nr:TolC family protein [Candidatus Binatia bacterium]